LLVRGELVTDVSRMPEYMPAELDELLAIKRRAEQQQLDDAQRMAWIEAADAWLRDVRRAGW
jgi:hypothetical protein